LEGDVARRVGEADYSCETVTVAPNSLVCGLEHLV